MFESKHPKKSRSTMQAQGIMVTIPCIDYSSINFGSTKVQIGKGSYGAVYSAQINFNHVAVKEFIAEDFSEKTKRQIDGEAKVMAEVGSGSNYLVRLSAFCFRNLSSKII
jgi:Protein tyrosine and serine/threonine kinase